MSSADVELCSTGSLAGTQAYPILEQGCGFKHPFQSGRRGLNVPDISG